MLKPLRLSGDCLTIRLDSGNRQARLATFSATYRSARRILIVLIGATKRASVAGEPGQAHWRRADTCGCWLERWALNFNTFVALGRRCENGGDEYEQVQETRSGTNQ